MAVGLEIASSAGEMNRRGTWTSAPPNSAAPVFQAARGYEAYRINTPAQVLSGARSGVGGAIRVRTIRMGWPRLGQRNGARGLTQAVSAVGMIFNTHCNNAISHGPSSLLNFA